MPSRVVLPEEDRIPLSHGDWIAVRRRLNSGENKRMLKRGRVDGRVDTIDAGTAKVLAYLLDWSFTGPDGKVIPIFDRLPSEVEAAIDLIDPASYTEILRAIERHEAAQDVARDEEKKTPPGAPASSATLPSPPASAGDTNGSTNSTPT